MSDEERIRVVVNYWRNVADQLRRERDFLAAELGKLESPKAVWPSKGEVLDHLQTVEANVEARRQEELLRRRERTERLMETPAVPRRRWWQRKRPEQPPMQR